MFADTNLAMLDQTVLNRTSPGDAADRSGSGGWFRGCLVTGEEEVGEAIYTYYKRRLFEYFH